jgi:hypothetical protein
MMSMMVMEAGGATDSQSRAAGQQAGLVLKKACTLCRQAHAACDG